MRRLIACLTLAAAAFLGPATPAQEPEAPEVPPAPEQPEATPSADEEQTVERSFRLFGEASSWYTQPIGADYVYATENDPTAVLGTSTRNQEFGTNNGVRWRAGAIIKGDVGTVLMTYWATAIEEPASILSPGNFYLGETLVYPIFAGVNNDGLADGVSMFSETKTRDTRFDFMRDAFQKGRMSAKWLAGLRFVDHNQTLGAVYYALVPDLPPLIDNTGAEATRLIPENDSGGRQSLYSGRGIEAGFEASYQVLPMLHLEGSFVYALLRGKTRASYVSKTSAYTVTDPETGDVTFLSPDDYQEVLGNPANFENLNQQSFVVGIRDDGSANSASVLEANLGFRWRAWKTLDVLGGIRQSRYQDVVLELRPRDPTLSPEGSVNYRVIDKEYRSVGYEGYYLGLAYTY